MIEKIIKGEAGERYIGRCDHCGSITSQKILFQHTGAESFEDEAMLTFQVDYVLTECETCNSILLYGRPEYDDEIFLGHVLYPAQSNLSTSIPIEIRQVYAEAKMISKLAPNAFAVQIRRALEYLCDDKKISGRNLNEQVKNMVEMGLVPPVLATMTNGLRILGNVGAHASSVEVEAKDVVLIDDFFKAILEYIYVAPGKIEVLRKRLEEMK